MHIWALILAAGHGSRLNAVTDTHKQFLSWKNKPLFWHSAAQFAKLPALEGIIFTFPEQEFSYAESLLSQCLQDEPLGLPCKAILGGKSRQESVFLALHNLPLHCTDVMIHDSARPFVSAKLIVTVFQALQAGAKAVIPGLPLTDTIKEINLQSTVTATLNRENLRAVQTPQGFKTPELVAAHASARKAGICVTDDAALMEYMQIPVQIISGEKENMKITTPEDLALLKNNTDYIMPAIPCVGFGYDVHSYGGEKPVRIGGITIEHTNLKIKAHSDGDVLLHALIDALLGCIAAGDIGLLFPDTDQKYENINSAILLHEVLELTKKHNLEITHVDMTIVAQAPKIAPYRLEIVKNVAKLLHLQESSVNLKATTEESLGFTGALQGLKAIATVTGLRKTNL